MLDSPKKSIECRGQTCQASAKEILAMANRRTYNYHVGQKLATAKIDLIPRMTNALRIIPTVEAKLRKKLWEWKEMSTWIEKKTAA
jgi:hypothetical protein